MRRKCFIAMLFLVLILTGLGYCLRFYPQQQMPVGTPLFLLTPDVEKYHDDCLHPCVRRLNDSMFVMVQSPYYAWNNFVENPMIFYSKDLRDWGRGILLRDTPEHGYNSDPNVFVNDSSVYVFWRECNTLLCDSLKVTNVITGGKLDAVCKGEQLVFMVNSCSKEDYALCPILIQHDGKYRFYATWYQYEPERTNKGIAIWEGGRLDNPDFVLTDTLSFENPLVCDKWIQKRIGNWICYIPKPKRYDLWHFDLFEYNNMLYMVSCAEKDDNIMLSVSEDWKCFKTFKKPLINNHYSENFIGYRQYYYKPTAIVQNDSLYLYYTANAQNDINRNQLFLSVKSMKDLKY